MLEGMLGTSASLTRRSISPGEEESDAWETALSMPKVVDMTSAAGTPLPVASPTTSPRQPPDRG